MKLIINETVSASKLIRFKKWLDGVEEKQEDENQAIKIGNLIDALITQPDRINMFSKLFAGHIFSNDEYELINKMHHSFLNFIHASGIDLLIKHSQKQCKYSKVMTYQESDLHIQAPMKCIYDIVTNDNTIGIDIKTTQATTKKAFINGLKYTDQDQSRYIYNSLSNLKNDYIIGISKIKPYNCFLVNTIEEGFMKTGRNKLLVNLLDFYLYA